MNGEGRSTALGIQIGLENDLSGSLVDDTALLVSFAARLAQVALSRHGGKAFVSRHDFATDRAPKFFHECGDLLRGGAVGPIHVAWEPDDNGADLVGLDDLADAADG